MAHRSWVSPVGKWILVSEMDTVGWRPCRLLPFDGNSIGDTAGPRPALYPGGWGPDGTTMYFSADARDGYHIWRQRFPTGALVRKQGSRAFKSGELWTADLGSDRSEPVLLGVSTSDLTLHRMVNS